MIGTLAWKEYREHQQVWVALAGLAIVLIVLLTLVSAPHGVAGAPPEKLHIVALAALLLAGIYGLICGAIMVAGEAEGKTQTFLDTLPASRLRLWFTKVLMGGLFTLAHALVLTGVLVALGLTEVKALPDGWQMALPLIGLEAFVYGLFGSVLGRSVLSAVCWALLPLTVSWLVGGEPWWPPSLLLLAARGLLMLGTFGLATVIYCRLDWQRGGQAAVPQALRGSRAGERGWGPETEPDPQPRRRRGAPASADGWTTLIWLALRQGWARAVLLAALGFLGGLLLPESALVLWPTLSLLVGVFFGIGVFSGEQTGDAYRFLGSQRLPPSRLWLAKAGTGAALMTGVLVVMLLRTIDYLYSVPYGGAARPGATVTFLGSHLLAQLPKELFALLWPVYGFSVGQLLALVCRKSAVALVLSLLLSVPFVGVWVPSLVAGGLKLWQIVPPAALLLLSTRLGLWAWISNELRTARPILTFLGCVALAGVWVVGNFAYRAVEIPAVRAPFDVTSLLLDVQTAEHSPAGALIRRAMQNLREYEQQQIAEGERLREALQANPVDGLAGAGGPLAAPPPDHPPPLGNPQEDPLEQVLTKGWPKVDGELGAWLETVCQQPWVELLHTAANAPLGMVEELNLRYGALGNGAESIYERAAGLLAARALQLQAHGDAGAALDHLLWTLALSRNLRHLSVQARYQEGQAVEAIALHGFDRWLEKVGPQTELLRRALAELNLHEQQTPDPAEPLGVEYLALHERLEQPVYGLSYHGGATPTVGLERDVIGLALLTPWERERVRRLLDAVVSSRLKEVRTAYWGLSLTLRSDAGLAASVRDAARMNRFVPDGIGGSFTPERWQRLLNDSRLLQELFPVSFEPHPEKEAFALCRVRAARIKLALAYYQAREGKPAQSLVDLVPHYLAELPLDPFSGQPFHYRVSTGQRMEWRGQDEQLEETVIPAGQGILWTAGPEATASLSRRGMRFVDRAGQEHFLVAPDRVFVVPSWAR